MAELLLGLAINLAHKLIPDDGSDSMLSSEVQKLRGLNLYTGGAYLEDAEQRQLTDKGVKKWLADFKDVCYDMIDVVDEWNLLQTKLQMKKKLVGLSSFSLFFLTPIRQFIVRHDTAQRIRNLSEKMEALCRSGAILELGVRDRLGGTFTNSSLVNTPVVIGLDFEKKTLISKLISEGSQEQGLRFLCIFGMEGIGKTTLAQLVYNSKEVQNHFELKAWVCVSEEFDLIRIVRTVIERLTSEAVSMNVFNLELLVLRLQEITIGKRFLLVLDDLRNETGVLWSKLWTSCGGGAAGSAILITTHSTTVKWHSESAYTMEMNSLSDVDSWSLFKRFLFGKSTDETEIEPELKAVGRTIVNKCGGLPIAVKTIGNLRRDKRDKNYWLNISEKFIMFSESNSSLSSVLKLSYIYLRPALKQCLLHCFIFPKGHPIDVDKLVRLWMAQDYLESEENDMEIKGNLYCEELLSLFFIQFLQPNRDHHGNSLCSINGPIFEFFESLATMECSAIPVNQKEKAKMDVSSKNGLHWTINIVGQASFPIFVCVPEKVLTLMIVSEYASIDLTSLSNLLCHFKRLRTLDMSRCLIRKLPLEVGKLLHLRYLDISYNSDLKELPEEICDLSLLQT